MLDHETAELIDIGNPSAEGWAECVMDNGWGDGMPAVVPTEEAIAPFVAIAKGINEPFPPLPPRLIIPTIKSLAANAVMAGCKAEYFPIVIAAMRAMSEHKYNLHGSLATTHPCGNMIMVSGPEAHRLGINSGSNCFGQGTRANAVIGRAIQLIMRNLGGAVPGTTDRSTQGTPGKYSFCFAENEEASPWPPYRVTHGFSAKDTVVTVMPGEAPHNINDHASITGDDILTTAANTMAQSGSNNLLGQGPCFVVWGPEHAETLHRDKWTAEAVQDALYDRSKVHESRISKANREFFAGFGQEPVKGYYYLTPSPQSIHIAVAGGPGKHSAFIPSFGLTEVVSMRV